MAMTARFETKPTTWEEVDAGYPADIAELRRRLRDVVVDALPDTVTETVAGAKMMGYAQYWLDGRNDVLAMISPEDEHVKLYTHHVRADATGRLKVEGTGKNARHTKIFPATGFDEDAVRGLLDQVVAARAAQSS